MDYRTILVINVFSQKCCKKWIDNQNIFFLLISLQIVHSLQLHYNHNIKLPLE